MSSKVIVLGAGRAESKERLQEVIDKIVAENPDVIIIDSFNHKSMEDMFPVAVGLEEEEKGIKPMLLETRGSKPFILKAAEPIPDPIILAPDYHPFQKFMGRKNGKRRKY